jgi:hypothetical protein
MNTAVTCPSCAKKLKAPHDAAGKAVKCICGHSFVLRATELPVPVFELPDDDGQALFSRRNRRAVPPSGRTRPQDRYPWLATYITWMRIGAIVGLIGGVVAGAFFLIKGIPLTSTGATLNNGAYLIGFGVGTLIGSLAEFIGTFALTEFIKVMMDIEANTRALLDRSP